MGGEGQPKGRTKFHKDAKNVCIAIHRFATWSIVLGSRWVPRGQIYTIWVYAHGQFEAPPRDWKFTKQLYHCFSKEEAQLCLRNKKAWVIGDEHIRNLFIWFMDVLGGNLAQPNESIRRGVPENFVKIDFALKAFGDVGRATLKSKNITAHVWLNVYYPKLLRLWIQRVDFCPSRNYL